MTCDACGYRNVDGLSYCQRCGSGLIVACAHCANVLPFSARFCDRCGARVGYPESPRWGDRSDPISREVTVLVVDIVGSTNIAERLDVERWHRLLRRLYGLASDVVEGCGGTVTKFMGDGALAVFGLGEDEGDHARQAALAAIELIAAVRGWARELRRTDAIELAVRVGLSSGEVELSSPDVADPTGAAFGPTVRAAIAAETAAAPGGVCVTETTAALVRDCFELRPRLTVVRPGAHNGEHLFEIRERRVAREQESAVLIAER